MVWFIKDGGMTQYNYSCPEDKILIENAINALLKVVFGSANKDTIKEVKEDLSLQIRSINVYPQGTINEFVTERIDGCMMRNDDYYIDVYMRGYKGALPKDFEHIKEVASHELCHVLSFILPYSSVMQVGDVYYDVYQGTVQTTVYSKVGPIRNSYGLMFNETMMDTIATLAVKNFDTSLADVFTNDVFKKRHGVFMDKDGRSGYTGFTSLTRLAIAAFSNAGRLNYGELVNDGKGIFSLRHTMKDGTELFANDFLYGILFNPLHIKTQFDKYMGEGKYIEFCRFIDAWYYSILNKTKPLTLETLRSIITRYTKYLTEFLDKKLADYSKRGYIDSGEFIRIKKNFYAISSDVKDEYIKSYESEAFHLNSANPNNVNLLNVWGVTDDWRE